MDYIDSNNEHNIACIAQPIDFRQIARLLDFLDMRQKACWEILKQSNWLPIEEDAIDYIDMLNLQILENLNIKI